MSQAQKNRLRSLEEQQQIAENARQRNKEKVEYAHCGKKV